MLELMCFALFFVGLPAAHAGLPAHDEEPCPNGECPEQGPALLQFQTQDAKIAKQELADDAEGSFTREEFIAAKNQRIDRFFADLNAQVDELMARDAEAKKNAREARSFLAIESNLREFPDDHFLSWSQDKSIEDNIGDAFDHFIATSNISADLNQEETDKFKGRVFDEMKVAAKHAHLAEMAEEEIEGVWQEILREAIAHEKPVVTHAVVQHINSQNLGWEAKFEGWMMDTSSSDDDKAHGLVVDEDEKTLEKIKRAELLQYLLQGNQSNSRTQSSFDASSNWPHCAELLHVRDQGRCGSCWAFAAATAVDHRLCIATNGGFNGPHAYISAGYMASCTKSPGQDGCGGGDPGAALRYMANNGVPTGFARASGCSPYFASGDATQHMSGGNIRSPACPTTCELDGYQRSLQEDLFQPHDLSGTRLTFNLASIKSTILQQGAAPIALLATRAFHSYSGGVFNPGCDLQPNHAVTAYGWNPGHILALNSYGTAWGDNGKFKLADCAVSIGYTVPEMDMGSGSYPLPLPAGDVVPSSPARRRRAPPPGQRSTTDGCVCKLEWKDMSSGGECSNYCCNPDSDPGGPWCFVEDSGACGSSWGYCAAAAGGGEGPVPVPMPVPMPVPVPVPVPVPSPTPPPGNWTWTVESGLCTMDTQGCIKSPNYPNKYLPDQACEFATRSSKYMDVKGFTTEANYDILTVNGETYSGSASPQGKQPEGSFSWSSDVSGEMIGWKICPSENPPPTPGPTPSPPPSSTRRRWQPPPSSPSPPGAAPSPASASTRRRWLPPPSPPSPPGTPSTRRRYVLH